MRGGFALSAMRLPKHVAAKILKGELGECWLWTAALTTGYGTVWVDGEQYLAHRFVYEHYRGPITEETLDHLCRVRRCVNPDHLEPVSNHVNVLRGNGMSAKHARQTHCMYGHEFTADNTLVIHGKTRHSTERVCKVCKRDADRKYREKVKQRLS